MRQGNRTAACVKDQQFQQQLAVPSIAAVDANGCLMGAKALHVSRVTH